MKIFLSRDSRYRTYKPTITSYDYDSPVSEDGQSTEKCEVIKRLVKKYHPDLYTDYTPTSSLARRVPVGTLYAKRYLTLTAMLDNLASPIGKLTTPVHVEYFCNFMGGRSSFYNFTKFNYTKFMRIKCTKINALKTQLKLVISL